MKEWSPEGSQRIPVAVAGVSTEEVVLQGAESEAEDLLSSLLVRAFPSLVKAYLVISTLSWRAMAAAAAVVVAIGENGQ